MKSPRGNSDFSGIIPSASKYHSKTDGIKRRTLSLIKKLVHIIVYKQISGTHTNLHAQPVAYAVEVKIIVIFFFLAIIIFLVHEFALSVDQVSYLAIIQPGPGNE